MSTNTAKAMRSVVRSEPLAPEGYDYADSFQVSVPRTESRSPEQLMRAALDDPLSRWLRTAIPLIHRWLLRFDVAADGTPDHLVGWRIRQSDRDLVHLSATGPLMTGDIVGRRLEPDLITLATFVRYRQRNRARWVWALTCPLHRAVAPFLLGRTRAAAPLSENHAAGGPP